MRTFAAHLVRGFTLVEVAMAMGVVSFSVLAMVGLNSVSLATLSDARKEAVGQRIAQTVASRLNTGSFADLQASQEYFDSEGLRVTGTSDAVYRADIAPSTAARFGETSLPADAAKPVEISVHRAPGGATLAGDANRIFHMFVVVPNREKGP
jgi:uncharacterized protein (TIGR02598 family)